jgi:hypothetical protein
LLLPLLAAPARAADDADIPDDLRDADYITAVDVEAEVPYGELYIDDAVIGIFPRLEDRLGGVLVGNVRLILDEVPGHAQHPDGSTGKPQSVTFRIEQAYLSSSLRADILVRPKGRALAARRWSGLSKKEQQQFLEIYSAASQSSWFEEQAEPDARRLRDPGAREFFTSFWSRRPRNLPPLAEQPEGPRIGRYDFRVDASGHEVTLFDYALNDYLLKLSGV